MRCLKHARPPNALGSSRRRRDHFSGASSPHTRRSVRAFARRRQCPPPLFLEKGGIGFDSAASTVAPTLRKLYATPWKPWTLVETLDKKTGQRIKKALIAAPLICPHNPLVPGSSPGGPTNASCCAVEVVGTEIRITNGIQARAEYLDTTAAQSTRMEPS